MENSLLSTKFVIIVYTIINFSMYSGYTLEDKYFIALTLVMYIILSTSLYIINMKYRKVMLFFISIFLYYVSLKYVQYIFLFPLSIYELLEKSKSISPFSVIVFCPFLYLSNEVAIQYLGILLIVYILYKTIINNNDTIKELIEINKKLKDDNFKLLSSKSINSDYDKQYSYVIKLEERNKIAQELHDKIGHTISASIMQLEASKVLADHDKEKALQIVGNVIKILREGVDSIRITLRNFKPPQEVLGINKIILICKEFESNTWITVKLSHVGNIDLISPKQFKIIQENLKEAFTNITKYSSATFVKINLQVYNKFLRFEIIDNGKGCKNVEKGLGLRGIEERVESIGGTLNIICNNGFSIVVVLPF